MIPAENIANKVQCTRYLRIMTVNELEFFDVLDFRTSSSYERQQTSVDIRKAELASKLNASYSDGWLINFGTGNTVTLFLIK